MNKKTKIVLNAMVGNEANTEASNLLALLGQRIGEPQNEREFRHLGGLNVNRTDGDPPRRAARRMTHSREI